MLEFFGILWIKWELGSKGDRGTNVHNCHNCHNCHKELRVKGWCFRSPKSQVLVQEFQFLNFSQRIPESWNYSGISSPFLMDISRLFPQFFKLKELQAGIRNTKNTECGPGKVLCKLGIERENTRSKNRKTTGLNIRNVLGSWSFLSWKGPSIPQKSLPVPGNIFQMLLELWISLYYWLSWYYINILIIHNET